MKSAIVFVTILKPQCINPLTWSCGVKMMLMQELKCWQMEKVKYNINYPKGFDIGKMTNKWLDEVDKWLDNLSKCIIVKNIKF